MKYLYGVHHNVIYYNYIFMYISILITRVFVGSADVIGNVYKSQFI